jgi:hypothetical protein
MAEIKICKNDDGYWLYFCPTEGSPVIVNISKVLTAFENGIINKTILKVCEELCPKK